MKCWWQIVGVWLAWSVAAHGQSPVTVNYQNRIEIPVPGVTAAFSLNSNVADAVAANGLVEISAKGPGTARIVIVGSAGVQNITVVVPVPPPVYPPGFVPPREGGSAETGDYEVRYTSDPQQVTNALTMKRTEGDSFDRLQVVNSTVLAKPSNSGVSVVEFPLASYEVSHPRRDMVFVDQLVANSPLTIDGFMVRGFHVRQGDWQFHGGFTSVATFEGLFLVTDPEETVGVTRFLRLDAHNSLAANFYYFWNPAKLQNISSNGPVGSLVYRWTHGERANLLAEAGLSHGPGFAVRGNYDTKKDHIIGRFRSDTRSFSSLAVNNQHGVFADLSANHNFTRRLYSSLSLDQSNYNLRSLIQDTFTGSLLLNYRLTRNFSVSGGSSYSRFQTKIPVETDIATLNLPAGIDFSTRHFGTGFQYQRSMNSDGTGGNDYSANARISAGKFQLAGLYTHDVQVPTLASILTQVPGLQDLLTRAGIVATTPEQIAQLLNNSALLATLGFTGPLTVNLAPLRTDTGATLTWTSAASSRKQLTLSYFNSNTELLQGHFIFTTGSASYSQRLGSDNDLIASASLFRTANGPIASLRPLFSISLQHRFYTVPGLLLPGHHGVIQGHVFRDDESAARYSGKQPAVGGVEVRLDENRVTHSDAEGFYSFHHVPFGTHTVEAGFQSQEPFFYTTNSPATADMNATVDFGISFAKGQIVGSLLNDAGKGINGVTVELQGPATARTFQTGVDGKFGFLGLGPGTYTVNTVPASYPFGYSLQNLQPQQVTVQPGSPAKVTMTAKAIRVVSGKVTVYDKTASKPVPLANAKVTLKELSLEAKTGGNGAYIFRNLPAGSYTLSVTYEGKEASRTIVVPPDPVNLRDMDIDAGPKAGS